MENPDAGAGAHSDGNTADVKIGNLVLIANPEGRERPKIQVPALIQMERPHRFYTVQKDGTIEVKGRTVSRGDGKFFDDLKWRAYPSPKEGEDPETATVKNG